MNGNESEISRLFRYLNDRRHVNIWNVMLLTLDACICMLAVAVTSFTDIDFGAYMTQVEHFLAGQRDYMHIKGRTGQLVYPAGFVYVYTILHAVTDRGQAIVRIQAINIAIHIITMFIVLRLYRTSIRVPLWAYSLLLTTLKAHILTTKYQCNDSILMALVYGMVLAFAHHHTTLGCTLFSLALSIKMAAVLYLPAIGLLLLITCGLAKSLLLCGYMAGIQFILALPFLMHSPRAYFLRAFDFGRTFHQGQSVNWVMLPERIFDSKCFHWSLLVAHVVTLIVGALYWSKLFGGLGDIIARSLRRPRRAASEATPSTAFIVTMLFTANLIGMQFLRSMHIQFHLWEAYQPVFLLWQTRLPLLARLGILFVMERGLIYPWTIFWSTSFFIARGTLIVALLTQVDWLQLARYDEPRAKSHEPPRVLVTPRPSSDRLKKRDGPRLSLNFAGLAAFSSSANFSPTHSPLKATLMSASQTIPSPRQTI